MPAKSTPIATPAAAAAADPSPGHQDRDLAAATQQPTADFPSDSDGVSSPAEQLAAERTERRRLRAVAHETPTPARAPRRARRCASDQVNDSPEAARSSDAPRLDIGQPDRHARRRRRARSNPRRGKRPRLGHRTARGRADRRPLGSASVLPTLDISHGAHRSCACASRARAGAPRASRAPDESTARFTPPAGSSSDRLSRESHRLRGATTGGWRPD